MKISFDLDYTLIAPDKTTFPTEKRHIFQRIAGVERIRYRTGELFKHLKEQGHQVGIYTTSYRPIIKLRFHLLTYGIKPDFIITEKENRKALAKIQMNSSKYPPAFNIDLHVDDSLGVEREGQIYNFATIIVKQDAIHWSEKIKEQVVTISEQKCA